MKHPFFAKMDFEKLKRKEITPSYIPLLRKDSDIKNFNKVNLFI